MAAFKQGRAAISAMVSVISLSLWRKLPLKGGSVALSKSTFFCHGVNLGLFFADTCNLTARLFSGNLFLFPVQLVQAESFNSPVDYGGNDNKVNKHCYYVAPFDNGRTNSRSVAG